MYIVVFYSYLLKLTEWLMLVISGIEFTTCFKNMPMQRTIPENITAAKAIVKIVIIIINLFKIYYLLFLKYECKVNTFLSNNGIFCREISLQYVFLDLGQPLVFSLENDILLSDICCFVAIIYIPTLFILLCYVCNKRKAYLSDR